MGHISDGSMGHGSIPMTHCLLCWSDYKVGWCYHHHPLPGMRETYRDVCNLSKIVMQQRTDRKWNSLPVVRESYILTAAPSRHAVIKRGLASTFGI